MVLHGVAVSLDKPEADGLKRAKQAARGDEEGPREKEGQRPTAEGQHGQTQDAVGVLAVMYTPWH